VNLSRRMVLLIFLALVILLVGMLFWPFILNTIINPISLVIWLLLRIFVLSLDQQFYWGLIIFSALVFIFRLLPSGQPANSPEDSENTNAALQSIAAWNSIFISIGSTNWREKTLKRELVHLLLSLYANKKHTSADFELYEDLKNGKLPIPEHIHNFLFPEKPPKPGSSLRKWFHAVRNIFRDRINRWSGKETAQHYRMIDEILEFMETSLEMKNDDGKFNSDQY
jgi:hypothetical protein